VTYAPTPQEQPSEILASIPTTSSIAPVTFVTTPQEPTSRIPTPIPSTAQGDSSQTKMIFLSPDPQHSHPTKSFCI
jgi:hypothetical protein